MGLISELMCKHTCRGNPLPSNIVFIAACNPYRQREKKQNDEKKIGLDINQAHKEKKYLNQKELRDIEHPNKNNLIYTVNPLPHSLLNYVFDFGNLTTKDENDYIKCIINGVINKIYYQNKEHRDKKNEEEKKLIKKSKQKEEKNEEEKLKNLKKLASEMIIEAQNYLREFNDKSIVSLRDIRRFNIFYEFFYKYLNDKIRIIKEENLINDEESEFYLKLDEYSKQVYSINLSKFPSIGVCYTW